MKDFEGARPPVEVEGPSTRDQPRPWTPPLERPARLALVVTEQLLRRIAFDEFPAGSHLPTEPNLAAEFKVSRTVIREAVRTLEDKGVISARQGRGTVVSDRTQWSPFDPLIISIRLETEPTTKLFRDLADVRLAVECQLARSAALTAEQSVVAELATVVDQQRQLTTTDPRYTDLDMRFHYLIAEASNNQIGRGIMLTLAPALRAMRRFTNEIPDARSHTIEWHGRILDRIRDGDPDGADSAMLRHLSWSRDQVPSLSLK